MLITLLSYSMLEHSMRYLERQMRVKGSEFCAPRDVSPIVNFGELRRLYFGNITKNSLKAFKMSYFIPLHRVLYHISVSILASTGGCKTDVTYISLHLFYEFCTKLGLTWELS